VWQRLLAKLSEWDPDWRLRAGLGEARPPLRSGGRGPPISNRDAFQAFAVALLSGNTRWDRIERVRGQLGEPFKDFRPERFAELTEADIDREVLPWFRERRAGAAGLRGGLLRLRQTAHILAGAERHPSADHLIDAGLEEVQGSPERLAVLLGSHKDWKLPGFGIALAAEALRILGFDLCKPDRHVLRALASWSLVKFARWDEKGPFTAPEARPTELLAAMLAVRAIAEANKVPVTYANSVIWFAGAVSGARLTNAELRECAFDWRAARHEAS
jgi:hypothetical protein